MTSFQILAHIELHFLADLLGFHLFCYDAQFQNLPMGLSF